MESGVCMSLGVCVCLCVYVCVCVCVASVCLCECVGEMEHDLPSDPLECVSLMNSSVTQLIAKPATDLAVPSSPRDPSAGLLKHDCVCISQLASRVCALMNSWFVLPLGGLAQ